MFWTQRVRTTKGTAAGPSGRPWMGRLEQGALAASALLLATTLTTSIAAAQSPSAPASRPAAYPPPTVTVDRITDNPGAYYGVAIKLVGDVEDVLGPRAFTLEDQDLLFDEKLLVVSARPFADQPEGAVEADMLRSQSLMISGTVHMFNEAAFEDRLGIDLNDDRVADWAGRPALIADRLTAWSPAIAAPWRDDSTNAARARGPETIEAIATSPMAYDGESATVGGYVDRVVGQHAFVMEDGDLLGPERVLVVTRQQVAGLPGRSLEQVLSTDGYLWVSGTVHQFNETAFEQQLGMELTDGQFAEWEGRSAIIAGSVIPVRWGAERRPPMAVTPGNGMAAPAAEGESSGAAAGGDLQGNTGIDAILNAPGSYVGQTTTVRGQVDEIVGTRSFVLTDADAEGEQLLVVSALSLPGTFARTDVPTPGDGQTVQVTDEVRRFDLAAVEERIGINLGDTEFTRWTGKPVIIATSVMPAAQ